jgi:hypothetical protein
MSNALDHFRIFSQWTRGPQYRSYTLYTMPQRIHPTEKTALYSWLVKDGETLCGVCETKLLFPAPPEYRKYHYCDSCGAGVCVECYWYGRCDACREED